MEFACLHAISQCQIEPRDTIVSGRPSLRRLRGFAFDDPTKPRPEVNDICKEHSLGCLGERMLVGDGAEHFQKLPAAARYQPDARPGTAWLGALRG